MPNQNLQDLLPKLNEGWTWSARFGIITYVFLNSPDGDIYSGEVRYPWYVGGGCKFSGHITDHDLICTAQRILREYPKRSARKQYARDMKMKYE